MDRPAAVVMSTLSPEKSASSFAVAVNTVSPDASQTPEVSFGQPRINTLSPDTSLTPASITFADGETVDVSTYALSFVDRTRLGRLMDFNAASIDSLITGRLLSEDEILDIDASKLFSIKLSVLSELFSSEKIRRILRARIEDVLKKP